MQRGFTRSVVESPSSTAWPFQGEYFQERYGSEAVQKAPPLADISASGVHVGAGTDGTRVATYNRWEALRLWTAANAWFTREEATKGALQPGHLADMGILPRDCTSPAPRWKCATWRLS